MKLLWISIILSLCISLNFAQNDPKVLRPCFERYSNYRLIHAQPYHSEWHMKREEDCLLFCAQTASRCRSVVYDTIGHICHFFLDDSLHLTIFAPKMTFLRVASAHCLQEKLLEAETARGLNFEHPSSLSMPQDSQIALPPSSYGIYPDTILDASSSPAPPPYSDFGPAPPLPPTDFDLLQAAAKNSDFGRTNDLEQMVNSLEEVETNTPEMVPEQQLQVVSEKPGSLGQVDERLASLSAELADLSSIPLEDTQFTGSFDDELNAKDKSNEILRDITGTEDAEKRWTDSLSIMKKKKPVEELPKIQELDEDIEKALNEKFDKEGADSFDNFQKYEIGGGGSFEDEKSIEFDPNLLKTKKKMRKHSVKTEPKLIKFDFDNAMRKKEVRRKPTKKFDKFAEGTAKKSFLNKAKSFAMNLLVNDAEIKPKKRRFDAELSEISDIESKIDAEIEKIQEEDLKEISPHRAIEEIEVEGSQTIEEPKEEIVKRRNWKSGCDSGDRSVWLTFENSINSEEGDDFTLSKEECKEECEKQNCRTMTYNEKDSKCRLAGGEGIWLTVTDSNDYAASTSTRFCFSESLPIFEGCTNFIAFRDYSLKVTPKEEFDGLPKGHEGMQLCIELCVLSNQYTCRSSSFDVRDGVCRLYEEDSLSMPSAFKPSHRTNLLYFENGCSQMDDEKASEFSSIERVEKLIDADSLVQPEISSSTRGANPPQRSLNVMPLKEVRIQPIRSKRFDVQKMVSDVSDGYFL